jgi:hypothetical protein
VPSRVLAHIGLPKTGTTYLPALLYANVEALRRQDVSVVGRHRLHYDAASEVAGAPSRRTRQVPSGAWDRVLRQLGRVETDRAVFSNERYSLVERDGAARMATTIGDTLPGCELHVVLTLRDMVAAEPSAWQEYVKNGGRLGWPEFCAAAVADPPELQRRRRARRMLAVWPELVPPERIHVVTVPPPGSPRGLLLERFCNVLGVDPAGLETTEPGRANTSLDFVATEMLRRVNARAPRLPVEVQRGEIKRFLANGVLSRREASLKPSLSGAALELARGENAWLAETLSTGGFDVVGDLADLAGDHPDTPAAYDLDPEDLLDAAVEAVAVLAHRSYDRGKQLRRLARQDKAASEEAARKPARRLRWRGR